MRLHTFWIGTSSTILLAACSSADGMGPRVTKLQDAVTQAKVSLRESVVAGQASVTDGKAVKAALLVDAAPEYSVGALASGTLHDVRLDIVSGSVTASTSWVPRPIRAPARSRSKRPSPSRRRGQTGPPSPSGPTTTTSACEKCRCSPAPSCGRSRRRATERCSKWRSPTPTEIEPSQQAAPQVRQGYRRRAVANLRPAPLATGHRSRAPSRGARRGGLPRTWGRRADRPRSRTR